MDAAILIAFITPALFHLGARATLTAAVHSRYPAWLAGFMNCAACAGAWYAMILAVLFHLGGWPIFASTSWLTVIAAGLASIWWTPIAVDLQERALMNLSTNLVPSEDTASTTQDDRLTPVHGALLDILTWARTARRHTRDEAARETFERIANTADGAITQLPQRAGGA